MSRDTRGSGSAPTAPFATVPPVGLRCAAVVHLPDGASVEAEVDLLAGRDRYSVGGQIAEGPRWWHGRLRCTNQQAHLDPGSQVRIELEDGRTGLAVVEAPSPDGANAAAVKGLGPPPFPVP